MSEVPLYSIHVKSTRPLPGSLDTASGDTIPCKFTPVILHGVVSPDGDTTPSASVGVHSGNHFGSNEGKGYKGTSPI